MGQETGISWTHHTFNPWWGCTAISPGCDHCYAETFDKRVGGAHWGKDAPRRLFGDKHWNEPRKWNEAAQKAGERRRVFCASMADVFDADAPEGQLERLWPMIRETPHLDWLLLTKRHGRIARNLPADWGEGYANVWLGVTVDDRRNGLPRVDVLRHIPARVRFLSVEPLLEDLGAVDLTGIHWAIMGGESGPGARVFLEDWARSLIQQCREQGVAPFVKQLGAVWARLAGATYPVEKVVPGRGTVVEYKRDTAGAHLPNWPADIQVQEFPTPKDGG